MYNVYTCLKHNVLLRTLFFLLFLERRAIRLFKRVIDLNNLQFHFQKYNEFYIADITLMVIVIVRQLYLHRSSDRMLNFHFL